MVKDTINYKEARSIVGYKQSRGTVKTDDFLTTVLIEPTRSKIYKDRSLALYFFTRFHYGNKAFSDVTRRENWYETAVFKADDPMTPVTCKSQHKIYTEAFKSVGIHTSKVTHANRKSDLNIVTQDNVSSDQQ